MAALTLAPWAPVANAANAAGTASPVGADAAARQSWAEAIERLARSTAGLAAEAPAGGASPSAAPAAEPPSAQPAAAGGAAARPSAASAPKAAAAQAASAPGRGAQRVEVEIGRLDPRLKLAPCQRIEPYWPAGQRPGPASRVGLRCMEGPTRWNVYLPVSVRLWASGWVAAQPLLPGTVLEPGHLREAEVDLAARPDAAVQDLTAAVGRRLKQPLAPGQALRMADLQLRQWVRPGDKVRVVARGAQFQIQSEALALGPAFEGQRVRARTDSGRVIEGVATGEREMAVAL